MTMQISHLLLYGKNGQVRRLEFICGSLNIITGGSKTGKTSIIDIVDYCFGSSECGVAEGVITDNVAWYGLMLKFSSDHVFIARAAPRRGKNTSSEVFIDIGADIEAPEHSRLHGVTNVDGLKEFLTRRIGIGENLHEVPEGQSRVPLAAQIRHSLFYLFQRQDEISSRTFLFHSQGEPFMAQALKDTMPFFLGAIEDNRLQKQNELRREKRTVRKLQRKIREISGLQADGLRRGRQLLAEASNAGLYEPEPTRPRDDQLIGILEKVTLTDLSTSEGQADTKVGNELRRLEGQRRELLSDLGRVKQALAQANEYTLGQQNFASEVVIQKSRLESIDLLPVDDSETSCPICESDLEARLPATDIVRDAILQLDNELSGVSREQGRVGAYVSTLRERRDTLLDQIGETRKALATIQAQDKQIQEAKDRSYIRARVIGRISLYLESIKAVDERADLVPLLQAAQERVENLERELRREDVEQILNSQLNLIGKQISEWAQNLKLEHSEWPLRLDIKRRNPNVVADRPSGPLPLERMGSGENWVGYHLVVLLAMHRWFVEQNRPVPRFIIFDQPTQGHYPPDKDQEGDIDHLKDEDRLAVVRMFKFITDVASTLSPHLQIIVTDHADINEEWFQRSVTERWRGDEKLVPVAWYSDHG